MRLIVVLSLLACLGGGCVNLTRPPELAQAPPISPAPTPEDAREPIDAAPGDTAEPDAPTPPDALAPVDEAPPLLPNAARCDSDRQCQSGACASGVCCATVCPGRCFACDLPSSPGTCAPVPAGQARPGQCTAEAVQGCGQDGTCDGQGGCRRYVAGTVCVPGSCTGATETGARTCDGAGNCKTAGSRSCAPNVCTGGSCATRCTAQGDCQTGFFCDGGGACRVRRNPGQACQSAVECGSGNCVDGVCCTSACTQFCFACNLPGQAGTCAPVPDGMDPGNDCAAEPSAGCGHDGQCDGKGGCRFYPPGTECAPPSCSDGISFSGRSCSALGTCGPAAAPRDCDTFACLGTTCAPSCTGDGQCQGGAVCQAPACAVPGLVLRWKLDEGTGTIAADASGNGLDGTYRGDSGIPASSTALPPVKFLDGASRAFASAQRQMIELAPMPTALAPTAELTLTAWYRATAIDVDGSGGEVISGGNNYLLRIRPGDVEYDKRAVNGGGGLHIRCFAAVGNHLDGNWHHLALVIDAAGLHGYFDGTQRCGDPNNAPMSYDLGNAFRVGRHGQAATTYDFEGNIDDVRVYRRALGPAEVMTLAQGGR
jgi:hypothetical protein